MHRVGVTALALSLVTGLGGVAAASAADGHHVALITYHTRLAPWIRLPACTLRQLEKSMGNAATSIGGSLSVHYRPYEP